MTTFDEAADLTQSARQLGNQLLAENESLRTLLQQRDVRIAELTDATTDLERELAECRVGWDAELVAPMTAVEIQTAIRDAGTDAKIKFSGDFKLTKRPEFLSGQLLGGDGLLDGQGQLDSVINLKAQPTLGPALGVTIQGLRLAGAKDAVLVPWQDAVLQRLEVFGGGSVCMRFQGDNGHCGVVLEDSWLHEFGFAPIRDQAALKFLNGDGFTSRRNVYSDGIGNGLWIDQDWKALTSEDDQFLRVTGKGLFNEVSLGPSEILRWTARGCGVSGLQINGSQHVHVGPGRVGLSGRDRGVVVQDIQDTRTDSYKKPVLDVWIEKSQITFEDADRLIVDPVTAAEVRLT